MTLQWYTLFSKPRHELQVANYLRSQNISIYFPTIQVDPVNPRASRIRPFFPRYMFVHADLAAVEIRALRWAPGAVGLVDFDGEPAVVPDHFIEELRKRVSAIDLAGGLHLDGLKQGDEVEIRSGPFAGYGAIFDARLKGEERVQVLLHWLGREIKVQVDARKIEKRHHRGGGGVG